MAKPLVIPVKNKVAKTETSSEYVQALVTFDPENIKQLTLLPTFDENLLVLQSAIRAANCIDVHANWLVGRLCAEMESDDESRYGKKIVARIAEGLGLRRQRVFEMQKVYQTYPDAARVKELESQGLSWTCLKLLAGTEEKVRTKLEQQLAKGKVTSRQLEERVIMLEDEFGCGKKQKQLTAPVQTGNTTAPEDSDGGVAATIKAGNSGNGLDHDPDAVDNANKERDEKKTAAQLAYERSPVRVFEMYRDRLHNAVTSLGDGATLAAEIPRAGWICKSSGSR